MRRPNTASSCFALSCGILLSARSAAGITLLQSTSVEGTSVASLARAFPGANTAGNLVVAFVRASSATQTMTITDTAGNAYAEAVRQVQNADGHQIRIFYAKNIRGGANTVTVTFSAANNHPWLALYEYSGLSTTAPLDQTAHAQGAGAQAGSGSTPVTTGASEVVFAGLGLPSSARVQVTAGTGYALLQQNASGASPAATEGAIVATTGSYAGTFALTASTNWSAVVATFTASAPLAVTTASLPDGTVGTSYAGTLAASGGVTPYAWSIAGGALPPGLSLAASTGAISGTPTTAGASDFTARVTDAAGQTATRALRITVNPAAGGGGTIGLVQSAAVRGTGVASLSLPFPQANAAGNLIIAFVRLSSTSQTVRVTDTAGNRYLDVVSQTQTADGHQIHILYASNVAAGANTVTATFSASNNHPWLAIYEYTGINTVDQTAHAQGNGTAATSGPTGTTSADNELLFAGLGLASSSAATVTARSGYALRLQDALQNGSRAATEDGLAASRTAYTADFGLGAAANWSCALATFRFAPPSTSDMSHYEYVFPDGNMYVYDIDNGFRLVKQVSLPQVTPIRGVVPDPATHTLFISYGGDGGVNGNGSMLAYDLLTDTVMWNVNYSTGIDSMAITPDGRTIYMPTGEVSSGNIWSVINASNGAVTGSIAAGAGPHNTIVSLDGAQVYMGPRNYNYLVVASVATNTVTRRIGPLVAGVRPFTINGRQTLAFTTATQFLGFQVGDINTGQVLYTVQPAGFGSNPNFLPSSWSHGISLSPDEREVWLMDGPNSYVHVYDVTGLPAAAPVKVADLPLTRPVTGSKSPCPYDCLREGWVQHSRDGRYVFVGDAGDVFDTTTRRPVVNLDPLYNSRIHLEIDWQNGLPVATTTRHGIGYVTR